jgi:hypothetical protein
MDAAVESTILDLAAKDKPSALLRLAVEIEKEMVSLVRAHRIELRRSATWLELVNGLTQSKVLDPQLAKALIEFGDIRNQVIHSVIGGPVQESQLSRALDNGLQLLRLLKATVK